MKDSKMKALPVRYLDKATTKRVQAYSVDFELCFEGHRSGRVECAFFEEDGHKSCFCSRVKKAFNVENVIFLEIKE